MTSLRPAARAISEPTQADYLLPASARERILAGIASNTRHAYTHAWDTFGRWCRDGGRMAFPVTAETMAAYVDHLAGLGRSPATIDQAAGCIRRMHRDAGFPDHPDMRLARDAMKGYRREWATGGGKTRKATPLVVDTLRLLVRACDASTAAGARNRAIVLLGFTLMGRRSELSSLDLDDLTAAPDGLDVLIRMSKTDQEARGETVFVPYGDHAETCPVRAVQAWRQHLAAQGITGGPLFRSVDSKGRIAGCAERPGCRALRLTGKSINEIVHRLALIAQLEDVDGYRAHSLRAGGATAAYSAGAPVAAIRDQGRWSEKSPTVLGYIRAVDKRKHNAMKGIGL